MTFREKAKREYPEKVDECYGGGVCGCPYEYGYEPRMTKECDGGCDVCWDREIHGTEEPPEDKPMSNADCIRAMSDEELACFIERAEGLGYNDSSVAPRNMTVLEWLRHPAEEG